MNGLRALEGFACVEAEKHQEDTERGGCTCGFCVWSVEHVVVMTMREVIEKGQREGLIVREKGCS